MEQLTFITPHGQRVLLLANLEGNTITLAGYPMADFRGGAFERMLPNGSVQTLEVITVNIVTYPDGFDTGWTIQVSPLKAPAGASETGLSQQERDFLRAVHEEITAKSVASVSVIEAEQNAGLNHNQSAPIIEKFLGLGYIGFGGIGAVTLTEAGVEALRQSNNTTISVLTREYLRV